MSLDPVDPQLLDHLMVEFGEHGERAVGFLRTAHSLLALDAALAPPRLAETIAYCLREAMKTIPASQSVDGGGLWRTASRAVSDARRRYELVRDVPGEDAEGALGDLLSAIDDLDAVHAQESVHERRLIAIMVSRTGASPVASGTAPIRIYQDLLGQLDSALHGVTTTDQAQDLWNRCTAILRQLFLPPEIRHLELEALAKIELPSANEVALLLSLIAGPNHLRHFLGQIDSPGWLESLTDTGILDPPAENEPWPIFAAVDRLTADHGSTVGSWLGKIYDRHPADPKRAWLVARAAVDLGPDAAEVLVRALRDYASVEGFAALGTMAVDKYEADSSLVEQLADLLLNKEAWNATNYVDPVLDRLMSGTDESNGERRLKLLCWKLSAAASSDQGPAGWFSNERAGSIADWDDGGREDRFVALLRALVEVIRQASVWLPTDAILETLDSLPIQLRGRLRAWILSEATEIEVGLLIDELELAIPQRRPTGDDLRVIDRVLADAETSNYSPKWAAALGPAPAVAELAPRLATHDVPEDWLRSFHWAGLLPSEVAGSWAQAVAVIASAYGPSDRKSLEKRPRIQAGYSKSPIPAEELRELSVPEAVDRISSWRPNESQWLVSARELARTLESTVKDDPLPWIEAPLAIASGLRHPTYIHHYIRGITEATKDGELPPVEEALDLVALVRAHPWQAEELGRSDFDYDHDWSESEQAAVEMLKAIADKDLGFAGRDDEVWDVLVTEARDRSAPSGIVSGARDPLDSAINRRCTRALEAVLSFMAQEFRLTGAVRPTAFELLEEALRLEGSDAAEHRAIIATRLGFLRHIAPHWVDDAADSMFGEEAPEGLAQITADLAIKWGRPNVWLLERYRSLLRNAVSRGVEHAVDHLLIAMLWNVAGYGIEENIAFLRQTPSLLSDAGEALGRLLRHDDADAAHIATAVSFWDAAVATDDAESLAGFGWLAEVEQLDSEQWAVRTMTTLAVTGGHIDWSHKVAERAALLQPSTTTLAIMNGLIRGTSDEWDRRRNLERAVELFQSADDLADTPEFQRLRTTLLERGAL